MHFSLSLFIVCLMALVGVFFWTGLPGVVIVSLLIFLALH